MTVCAQCGGPVGGRPDASYCSDACRQAAYRDRRRPKAVTPHVTDTGPVSEPTAVTPPGTATVPVDTLDHDIATLQSQIREKLWEFARALWTEHQEKPFRPPFAEEDEHIAAMVVAMVVAWQRALDLGLTQGDRIPDAPWVGLAVDDEDDGNWRYYLWGILEKFIAGVIESKEDLEWRWVERELRDQAAEAVEELVEKLADDLREKYESDWGCLLDSPAYHPVSPYTSLNRGDPRAPMLTVPDPRDLFCAMVEKVDRAAFALIDEMFPKDAERDAEP